MGEKRIRKNPRNFINTVVAAHELIIADSKGLGSEQRSKQDKKSVEEIFKEKGPEIQPTLDDALRVLRNLT